MNRSRDFTLVAVIVAFACLSAVPAAHGLGIGFDVTASKHKQGGYTGNPQDATIKQGKTKTFYWKVTANNLTDQELVFDDAAGSEPGYKVKWFKGKKNITEDVTSDDGYPFTLKQDKASKLRAKVKYTGGSEILCLGGQARNPTLMESDAAYFSVNGLCT